MFCFVIVSKLGIFQQYFHCIAFILYYVTDHQWVFRGKTLYESYLYAGTDLEQIKLEYRFYVIVIILHEQLPFDQVRDRSSFKQHQT